MGYISDTDRAKLEDLFPFREVDAIDVLCKKLDLNEVQVLRQALRMYQLIQTGLEKKYFTDQELMNFLDPERPSLKNE